MPTFQLQIFSPRWGHDDTYTVEFERDHMEISMMARGARADWRDNADPEWSGETVESMLENDSIYPPAVLQDMLEKVWTAWRGGELTEAEANAELQEVATWLNTVTHAKPRTDFWRAFF
jgi:hypothetical protein